MVMAKNWTASCWGWSASAAPFSSFNSRSLARRVAGNSPAAISQIDPRSPIMTTEKTADPAKKDQGLQYDSVKAWDAGIGEMDRTRAVVFVPRAEVRSLELAYISGAERPLIAILLGVVVLAVSVSPVLYLLAVLAFGGQMDVKLF